MGNKEDLIKKSTLSETSSQKRQQTYSIFLRSNNKSDKSLSDKQEEAEDD